MAKNPRVTNGSRRRDLRKRVAAKGEPCAICGKPIDYSLTTWVDPKDGRVKRHPMSYELDEIRPVSRWKEFGYPSPEAAALDPKNVRPTHRICNQRRGNGKKKKHQATTKPLPHSRVW